MKYWIIPCNIKSYDVIGAFQSLKSIDWKQSRNLKSAEVGDMVLIYVSAPYSCIKYVCKIKVVNKPKVTIDDRTFVINGENYVDYGNHMELKLVNELEEGSLNLKALQENGMKGAVQGPRTVKGELLDFVLRHLPSDTEESQSEEILLENVIYKEGKIIQQYGTRYERNPNLRKKAIEIHGVTCKGCGFNFEEVYGEIGKEFIEIHHIKPMYSIKEEIIVDPNTDLVPLCSNCHNMVHRKKEQPLTIEELKQTIKQNAK
ncbi:HNH endonuclease [Macrococcoides canis]|uniref:HNH endonuclease family protein n=2 Tax=Macrococcoides canis TaxID=1855823 RepID=A0A0D6DR50_9STAP|nr:HNH endonuclease [Macrococcus canis]UTH02456.1 HNH endonuclease [Macrococcus canis]WBF52873.1 HNH endonuclease [Macrococcus canis]CDO67665.1 HNH endonuclease family protein [Macrococcus canis]